MDRKQEVPCELKLGTNSSAGSPQTGRGGATCLLRATACTKASRIPLTASSRM